MTDPKEKPKPTLREPKAKKPLGLIVRQPLRMPHDELIKPESLPSQTMQSSEPNNNIAPQRDFTKFANSIHREAIPAGLFTGKSKQLYDCLYSLTRGAIVPTRTVRISRPNLMKRAGIGARVTFDANVSRLMVVGLIAIRHITGEHEGNEYTVLLPEEAASIPSQTSQTSLTRYAQKLVRLVRLETSQTRHTLNVDSKDRSLEPNTSLKTNTTNDDEAFADFVALLRQKAKEVTGRETSSSDRVRWRELGELLSDELAVAAERTSVVSSAPALLLEHLRRRLLVKLPARQLMKTPPPVAAHTPAPPTPVQSDEDLVETLVEFLNGGMSIDDLDGHLSKSVESERWPKIRAAVVERYEREQKRFAPPERDKD